MAKRGPSRARARRLTISTICSASAPPSPARFAGLLSDPANPRIEIAHDGSGLFAPDSVAWRVHIDVTGMMVGGIAALMLQMLHPKVLAGVWDHSGFRDDMNARLRGTARFIAQTTFETRASAEAQIARVRHIHDKVAGTLPDGTPYSANDPRLLAWVHVAEATSFLAGWIRYGEPGMSAADQDRYFAEIAIIGELLGADPDPAQPRRGRALIADFLPELKADERSREVLHLLLHQRAAEPDAGAVPGADDERRDRIAARLGAADARPRHPDADQARDPPRHARYRRDGALGATRLETRRRA